MLLLKLAGAVLVVGAGAALGHAVSQRYRQRPRELQQFQRALELLVTEISYAVSPLPHALGRAGVGTTYPVREVFSGAASRLASGGLVTAGDGWTAALDAATPALSLNAADLEIIRSLGAVFSMPGAREQVRHLELACRRLAQHESAARADESRYARLALQLGVLGALALTIVLL
ncbi:MAG: hypothetical protein AB1445_06010 [Bacillota bacterium]